MQESYPQLKERGASPEWRLRAWLTRDDSGRVLFAQRARSGLFGGLWELPTERVADQEKPRADARPFACVKHVLTHRVLHIDACEIPIERWRARNLDAANFPCWSGGYEQFRHVALDEALSGEIALAAAQLKILALCAEKLPLFD